MWKTVKLGDICDKVKTPPKLQKKEYLEHGVFPVVSQEASLISGYCNEQEMLFNLNKPVVVFGDHTQVLKYIDFDFVMGADGVKILQPIDSLNTRYFYYFLTLNMPKSTGYARHYKLLKKLAVPIPPLAEQHRIVAKLDAAFAEADTAIEATEAKAAEVEKLKTALLSTSLNDGSNNLTSREVKLGDIFKIGSSKRVLKADWKDSGVPFYRGREITALSKFGHVNNDLFISEERFSELAKKHGVPCVGDILVTAIGTIGNTHIVSDTDKFYFKDASVLWLNKIEDVNSEFVNYWFKSKLFTEQLDTGNGATVDTLSISKLNSTEIFLPPLAEQHRIVAKLDAAFAEADTALEAIKKNKDNLISLKSAILAQELQSETA